jgi:hypothetical protein
MNRDAAIAAMRGLSKPISYCRHVIGTPVDDTIVVGDAFGEARIRVSRVRKA